MKKIEVTQEEIEQRIIEMKFHITKGIKNIIGYIYLNPTITHVYVNLYRKGCEFGYYDEINTITPLYLGGETYKSGTRYLEAYSTKGINQQYDELGLPMLVDFLFNKQMAVLRKDLEELKIKENKKLTNKNENK